MANQVGIIGLREAVTLRHKPLKVIWIILVVLGAIATSYYIYKNIDEYINKEPATKVAFLYSIQLLFKILDGPLIHVDLVVTLTMKSFCRIILHHKMLIQLFAKPKIINATAGD